MLPKQNGNCRNDDNGHGLNIVIPIGGLGTRFARHGYRFPKPLINIIGRPMLLWLIDSLSMRPQDTLWVALNEAIDDEFRIGQLVAKSLPGMDIRTLRLRHQTKGASETLYIVAQSMDAEHLGRRTVSLDCDTIYWTDILQRVREIPEGHGGCFYFEDTGDKPIFSYIRTEESKTRENSEKFELILDIVEKRAISRKANTGAYVFPSAEQLRHWTAKVLDQKRDHHSGEYFTSEVILHMLKQGQLPFLGLPISLDDFSCVGTPEQLEELLGKLKNKQGPNGRPEGEANGGLTLNGARVVRDIVMRKRRFCFDLDMTLVGVPRVPGDYSTCPPIDRNIWLVRQLFEAGHYIIIQTARRMRTHRGNIGAVIADIGLVTMKQLEQYGIPYHDIHFGKPWADAYIDDLAVNSNIDTLREIGWMLDDLVTPATSKADSNGQNTMMAARDFNTVQAVGDRIIKSSKSPAILGELFFYSHMPSPLASIFPRIYDINGPENTGTYSISMERIRGTTFSHLLVGRSMTAGRLMLLLRAIHSIHHTKLHPEGHPPKPTLEIPNSLAAQFASHARQDENSGVNIYANYAAKLCQRYDEHRERYTALGPLAASLFRRIHEFLDMYEAEDKGVHVQVIHGDPVFSNAILSDDDGGRVRFVDMRGQLDNVLTTEGDIYYDLAKILQSLCGYDHILFLQAESERDVTSRQALQDLSAASEHANRLSATADMQRYGQADRPEPAKAAHRHDTDALIPLLSEVDRRLLDDLQERFFQFIQEQYSVQIHRKTLLRITASLLFSLIPLHRPELAPIFLRLCNDTLEKAGSMSVVASAGKKVS